MIDADRDTFNRAITTMASALRGEVTTVQREMYWRAMKGVSLEDALKAVEGASLEAEFMPTPGVLRRYAPSRQHPEWRGLPPIESKPPPPEVPTAGEMAEGTAHAIGVARRQVEDCRSQLRDMPPGKQRTEMVIRLSRHLGELDSAVANHRSAMALAEQKGADYRPPLRGSRFIAPPPKTQAPHWSDREPGADDFEEVR